MTIVDYLSNSIFSTDGTTGFNVAVLLFLLLTLRAIIQLGKLKDIIEFFKKPKTIGQLSLIVAWKKMCRRDELDNSFLLVT